MGFWLGLGVAALLMYGIWRRNRAPAAAAAPGLWLDVVRRLPLGPAPASAAPLAGVLDGIEVRFTPVTPSAETGSERACFSVQTPGIPADLMARPRAAAPGCEAESDPRQVRSGDPALDVSICLVGDEAEVLALLDPETRTRLVAFGGGQGRVEAGALVLDLPAADSNPIEVTARVRQMVALARRLSLAGRTVLALLFHNAVHDPLQTVRQRNLEALVRGFPQAVETRQACALAVENAPTEELLRYAAAHLGTEAVAHLVKAMWSEAAAASVRQAAQSSLVERLPRPDLVPLLEGVLERWDPVLRAGAIRALGRLRHGALVDRLADRLARSDPATAAAGIWALVALGEARAEPLLVRLLQHAEVGVRTQAATALGSVGTVAAVGPLRACAEAGGLRESELRGATHKAIQAIQERAGPVDPGRLSLAEVQGEAGRLSVAAGEGALSVADMEAAPQVRDPAKPEGSDRKPVPG